VEYIGILVLLIIMLNYYCQKLEISRYSSSIRTTLKWNRTIQEALYIRNH